MTMHAVRYRTGDTRRSRRLSVRLVDIERRVSGRTLGLRSGSWLVGENPTTGQRTLILERRVDEVRDVCDTCGCYVDALHTCSRGDECPDCPPNNEREVIR